MGIDDDVAALDFDLACAYRLELYDKQCRKEQAKQIIIELSEWWNGSS